MKRHPVGIAIVDEIDEPIAMIMGEGLGENKPTVLDMELFEKDGFLGFRISCETRIPNGGFKTFTLLSHSRKMGFREELGLRELDDAARDILLSFESVPIFDKKDYSLIW